MSSDIVMETHIVIVTVFCYVIYFTEIVKHEMGQLKIVSSAIKNIYNSREGLTLLTVIE